jgi:alanyl-tRNA synthetase
MLSSQEIKDKFTSFFVENKHEKLDSSPLIPQNDPTLLFANAGMNQFKDYFTGKAQAKNPRAVTIQKCVRAGGKHNDLENVGFTARHHTFFEMLGNFSFGDYFKKEAIAYAWKFLTVELKIPKERLYITVHESDEEARKIWHEQEGVPLDRIFYLGDKDNFWEMGDIGPCGPCSEIFFDHGVEFSDGSDTSDCLLNDEGRYGEVWNLVFMQYEKFKDEKGNVKRRELPKPCVDTGAGLERLTACLQGVYWNYDIDSFKLIIAQLESLSGKKYDDKKVTTSMRVVCDHIRASVMLITDGVIPSNEGRGYVLRRIIRRAIRHLNELGIKDTSFYTLVPTVFEFLGTEYPQNKSNLDLAIKLLKIEEEKFRQTLKTGLELLNKEIKALESGEGFSGKIAFKLYDTYGFPLDLTQTILAENKIDLDITGFETSMQKQKESSKASSKFEVKEDNAKTFYAIKEKYGDTNFIGYNMLKTTSQLLAIESQGDLTALVFDQTTFYAEGGGQVGDIGVLYNQKNEIVGTIADTVKPVEGVFAHLCQEIDLDELTIGESYTICVDKENRELTMRNHSATHLLQAALIKVLGNHVKQAGSRVSHDSLRFDFTHPEAMTKKEILAVEKLVNSKISESLIVEDSQMTKDEATAKGAMALFGEKYGDSVRVLEMGDFSLELCGGTHVKNTKDIGLFTINLETSLSSGVRRIEALTSINAFNFLSDRSNLLGKIEKDLSAKGELLLSKLESLQKDLKIKNKEIQKLNDQIQAEAAKDMFDSKEELNNGISLVKVDLKGSSSKELRSISDKFIDQNKKDVLLLYIIEDQKISYLIRTHKANKNLNCSSVMKSAQEIISGRGGGRPDMAQGSGSAEKSSEFLTAISEGLRELS